MKRYGIFLNVWLSEQPMQVDDRPLLRAALLAVLSDSELELVIATPTWFQRPLRRWLKQNGGIDRRVKVLRSPRLGLLLRAISFLKRCTEKTFWREVLQSGKHAASRMVRLVGSRRRLVLAAGVLSLLPLTAAVLLLSFMAGLIATAIATGVVLVSVVGGVVFRRSLLAIPRAVVRLSRTDRVRSLYALLLRSHLDALVKLANKETKVQAWLVAEPYALGDVVLVKPKVTFVPRLLPLVDPFGGSEDFLDRDYLPIVDMLDRYAGIICHDDSIRDKHLVYGAGLPRERITVVPYGRYEPPLKFGATPDAASRLLRSKQIIRPFQIGKLGNSLNHAQVDLGQQPFIIYSGESGPHYHCLVLFQALRRYLHGNDEPIRLVIHSSLLGLPMMKRWLDQEAPELAPYIIGITDTSPLNWAALNALARCAIDPSLFSPRFPETFSQAVCM